MKNLLLLSIFISISVFPSWTINIFEPHFGVDPRKFSIFKNNGENHITQIIYSDTKKDFILN